MDEPPHTLLTQFRGWNGNDQSKKLHPSSKNKLGYVIDKLDDHWADLVDSRLGITREDRDTILDYGPEKFN